MGLLPAAVVDAFESVGMPAPLVKDASQAPVPTEPARGDVPVRDTSMGLPIPDYELVDRQERKLKMYRQWLHWADDTTAALKRHLSEQSGEEASARAALKRLK
jgi:hypothetical protein